MSSINRRQFLRVAGVSAVALQLASRATAAHHKGGGSHAADASAPPVSEPGTLLRCDLSQSGPAARLSHTFESGRWQLLDYVTDEGFSGVMACALPESDCGELTLPLEAHGWYRIYVGLYYTKAHYHEWPSAGQLEVKLSGEPAFRRVGAEIGGANNDDDDEGSKSSPHRSIQESYWKTAELTGKSLVFRQLDYAHSRADNPNLANLSYVKLVPVAEADAASWRETPPDATTRNMALFYCGGRFTGSTHGTPSFHPTTREWFETEFTPFVGSDVGLFVFEALRGNYCCYRTKIGDVGPADNRWRDEWLDPLAEFTRLAHANGMKILTALRMIGPQFPMNREPIARASYYWRHPEWTKLARDGTHGSNWSLAFPEARAYWLSLMRETLEYGTDGLQLYLNRSTPVVLYEEPTVRAFQHRYGEDPRKLDAKDPRWLAHCAGYVTQFLREIRALVDEKPGRQLGVTIRGTDRADYDPVADNCDVDAWLRAGLVDYVMCTPKFEPGLLKKWRSIAGDKVHFWPDLMPRAQPAASYARLAKEYYAAGADGFSLWDGDGRPPKISQWAAVRQLGHRQQLDRIIATGSSYYRAVNLTHLGGFSLKDSFRDG